MPTSPAVCPLCAQVRELNPHALPAELTCEGCGETLEPEAHGMAVVLRRARPGSERERPEVTALLKSAEAERKPDRAHALILRALDADPDSFAAHRALLYHGRLHEVVRRPGDFSLIKCHLLHMYEHPGKYAHELRDAQVEELFRDPLLARTQALSGEGDAFLRAYLEHLAGEYLHVFVRGSSAVSRGMFGFPRSAGDIRDQCGRVVASMEQNVRADPRLTGEQQEMLCGALRKALKDTY